MSSKKQIALCCVLSGILFSGVAFAIMYFVANSGVYPSGEDTLYHIYRGKYLYRSISEGNLYPLYDMTWFNGSAIMRYRAPLCVYIYALCEAIGVQFSTDPFIGYIVFTGFIFLSGACIFLCMGIKEKRPIMGAALGILVFFTPADLRLLFGEGNLPGALASLFTVLVFFGICKFRQEEKGAWFRLISIAFALLVLSDLYHSFMVAVMLLLFLTVDIIVRQKVWNAIRIIEALVMGTAIAGVWFIPFILGNVVNSRSDERAVTFVQSIFVSLDPMLRLKNNGAYYFGAALALIALLGWLFSYRKTRAGFASSILALILSTPSLYIAVKMLPGSENIEGTKFFSVGGVFILVSFLMWDTLKKPIAAVLTALLLIDCIPSLSLVYGNMSGANSQERLDTEDVNMLLRDAGIVTKQRLLVLDEGKLGPHGAVLASSWKKAIRTASGAMPETAETYFNLAQLNSAYAEASDLYVFDRALEFGCDTVLISTSDFGRTPDPVRTDAAAEAAGYRLYSERFGYRLYEMKEWYGTNWGVVSEYDAIAIGKGSASIAKLFPSLKEASESQIDNYTLDELKQYKLVVLSGFTYKDETAAENLLLSLSRAGVRVVISADGIPEERGQKDEPFLGLTCNEINFSQGYPILDTVNGEIDTDLFPKDHRQWATVFIEGLDEVRGSVRDPNYLLPFYGTVDNENLVVIGLNLIYYYSLTQDIGVRNLLSEAMNISPFDLPKRSICPLQTEYSNGKITIRSEADNINTTLAFHDMFTSDRPIISENNLLYVNSGTTEISFDMSKMIAGAVCTAVSLILMIVQSFNLYGLSDKRKDKGDLKE